MHAWRHHIVELLTYLVNVEESGLDLDRVLGFYSLFTVLLNYYYRSAEVTGLFGRLWFGLLILRLIDSGLECILSAEVDRH